MTPTPEQDRAAGAIVALAWWLLRNGDRLVWVVFALAVLAVGGVLLYRVLDALATLRLKRSGAGALDALRASSGWDAPWLGARGPDGRTGRYHAYLASPQWAERSRRTITLAGGTCQRCGRRKATQAHHVTYDRLTRERDADLLAVCAPCHRELHGR
jgi:hypothetical protein